MHREPALLVLADGTVFEGEAFGAAPTGRGLDRGGRVQHRALAATRRSSPTPPTPDRSSPSPIRTSATTGSTRPTTRRAGPTAAGSSCATWPTPRRTGGRAGTLEDFLADHGVPGITGIDTRRLTRHLRDHGSVPCAFGTAPEADLAAAARAAARRPTGATWSRRSPRRRPVTRGDGPYRVVAYDFGIKEAMLRQLGELATVTVVPASHARPTTCSPSSPDGIFLSNGPGDPAALPGIVGEVGRPGRPRHGAGLRDLPRATSCWPRALGATTYKLPFGHHGGQPPGPAHRHRTGRDHLAEPQLRGGRRLAGRDRGHPRQPQRRGHRGSAQHRGPGIQRAVPPRGRSRPPRRPLPVRGVPDAHGRHRRTGWRRA